MSEPSIPDPSAPTPPAPTPSAPEPSAPKPAVSIRAAQPGDLAAVLALNQAAVPQVGATDLDELAWFLANAFAFWVAEPAGEARGIGAFLIALTEGSSYVSPNYRWFAARYERFVYVDRIAVDPAYHGGGTGRALYRELAARARARQVGTGADRAGGDRDRGPVLTAEVNVRPRNDRSLAFHERFGFHQVGEQEDARHGTRVAMLACHLGGEPSASA